MRILDAAETAAALPFKRLIAGLREAFIAGGEVPLRHRHGIAQQDGTTASLLLMPAWRASGRLGVKVVSVFPGNGARGLPVGVGELPAVRRRNRRASRADRWRRAHAATHRRGFGARRIVPRAQDAKSLLIVGSGHVGGLMAEAYRAVRPIERVRVWNIRAAGAERLAARLRARA